VVDSVDGVGINNPKGVEGSTEKRLTGGDVEGENIIHPRKPGEHRIV